MLIDEILGSNPRKVGDSPDAPPRKVGSTDAPLSPARYRSVVPIVGMVEGGVICMVADESPGNTIVEPEVQ